MDLCDRNCVMLRTNRARCAKNKKSLNLLNEESIMEHAVVELVYKFYEKSLTSV